MSSEYIITPTDTPDWRFDGEDFLRRIRERWPSARTGINTNPNNPMPIEALIPFESPPRNLGVALSNEGYTITLDPADPNAAAEFASWLASQLPASQPPVHLYTTSTASLELRPDMPAQEIESWLETAP